MQLKEVKLTQKPNSDILADNLIYKCNFCQKNVTIKEEKKSILEKLSGEGFYCAFCLSNNYNTKNNRNILMLSFRAIFGYYYLNFYKIQKMIYISQIEDIIDKHIEIGLKNPCFKYDPKTMLWFVDFNKIGKGKKKISLKEVTKTINEIIDNFDFCKKFQGYKPEKLIEKYTDALNKFYSDRYRPYNRKILIPTISGCLANTEKTSSDETKKFTKKDMCH